MQLSNHVNHKGREIEGQVDIVLLRIRKARVTETYQNTHCGQLVIGAFCVIVLKHTVQILWPLAFWHVSASDTDARIHFQRNMHRHGRIT